jgi:ketosteroid isomerase-like protein
MSSTPEATVRRYLDRLVNHDWDAVAECLHPEVVRVGPFNDTYTPRDRYVKFLATVLPSLVDYEMTVQRLVASDSVVMVQLTETMELDGSADVTREVLVFDTDPGALIIRIDIFIQRGGG